MSDGSGRIRLDARVRAQFELSWNQARSHIATGKIWSEGRPLTDEAMPVPADLQLELRMNAPRPRAGTDAAEAPQGPQLTRADLVHVDTQIVVVRKPAGLSTVPFEKDEQGTLIQQAARLLGQPRLHVVQRLDRETSGLLVFARNAAAEHALAQQFRFHTIRRCYLALAHGEVRSATIRSLLVENRGDGLRGSIPEGLEGARLPRHVRDNAKHAVTQVDALSCRHGRTLIECRLQTGRTHQIRIHLSEAGHPLLGEKGYNRDYPGPWIPAPRILLHAAELGFIHPVRQAPMRWIELPPADFLSFLDDDEKNGVRELLSRES